MTIEEMKKRKKELGYSYTQLSELSGVPLGTVQKIFGGITKAPRHDTLQALEQVLAETQYILRGRRERILDGGSKTKGDYLFYLC